MLWHELTVLAAETSQEMVSHYLYELGAAGVSIEESWSPDKQRDNSLGQWYDKPLNDIRPGYAELKAYFAEEIDLDHVVAQLDEALKKLPEFGYDAGEYVITTGFVRDEDWADAWKQYFKPVRITERLTIKPTWEHYEAGPDERIIELDPGMAFGTGTHPTTALCLRMLERHVRGGETVVDVGTGSGVLAIGAAKLGAARVLALDLDPVAVSSATDNIRLNGLQDVIEVQRSDLLGVWNGGASEANVASDVAREAGGASAADIASSSGQAPSIKPPVDLVVANILAEIILLFTADVMNVLKPGGIYIASGIYKNKEADVEAGLREAGFDIADRVREEDWIAFVARKPKEDGVTG